ncbi:hypothetical protein AMTRI_Chr11g151170 [Amborella trichopoda]|uniref:Germin-like protein n=1 Tax=Amborella trichopoda TaxID=13333 RepID=W1PSL4_AMBTC|nr:germin-like protein 9-3 [Amborella trichopoda]ERN13027.1 hypothetical protein AMTR_s00040p00103850 [Amborella trichopoda]|eukprot:XP_020527340.1 germin-like protein 9-3 [Amborella trichopoda]
MASSTIMYALCMAMAWTCTLMVAKAGDPDILTDFILPKNLTSANPNFFTFTGMRNLEFTRTFKVTKASKAEFPALEGQSVSYAVLQYPAGSINPVHTHPRSSELLLVFRGSLEVGFVDTTGKLYSKTLQRGDMFVFPKGLVHYQYNANDQHAVAVSAFGSASAGTVSVPSTLFASRISDDVLAKSFKTNVATVKKLKAGLTPPKA